MDDDFDRMDFESASSDEAVTDDEVDSHAWSEIESESDAEFLKDHGFVEEVTPASEDCYRHFITDEIIGLIVREANRYAEQYLQLMRLAGGQKFFNGTCIQSNPLIEEVLSMNIPSIFI